MKRLAVVVGVCAAVLVTPVTAFAQTMADPADEAMCDLTPADGSWMLGATGVDMELTILGLEPFDVVVPGAVAGCANRWQYFDGTMISVGIYRMGSAADAKAASDALRTSADAATAVAAFPALGDGAWIARFEFAQLAFTHAGAHLIGGMSDESYGYSRDDYTELLVERMHHIVEAATGETPGTGIVEPHPEDDVVCVCDTIPAALPEVLVGGGTAAAAGATGVALGLPELLSRRRRGAGRPTDRTRSTS